MDTVDKRLVIRHTTGLHQIIGLVSQLGRALPGRFDNVNMGDHTATVTHMATLPRMVVYREIVGLDTADPKGMDPRQV